MTSNWYFAGAGVCVKQLEGLGELLSLLLRSLKGIVEIVNL